MSDDRATLEDLVTIGNAAALDNIQKDRCLLRRSTRLAQNKQYKLGKEDKERAAEEMCEDDDMKVNIDRSQKEIHNHYQAEHPPPPPRRFPWWLIVLAILPLILLIAVLVGWWLSSGAVAWQLNIDSV